MDCRYRGDGYAKGVQLSANFDPQPPLPCGCDSAKADQHSVLLLNAMHKPFVERLGDIIRAVRPPPAK